jgi:hypothetical protein
MRRVRIFFFKALFQPREVALHKGCRSDFVCRRSGSRNIHWKEAVALTLVLLLRSDWLSKQLCIS